ncbi:MAG: hypothetical protein ACQES0_01810 [Bacteroidota bacterium]
MKRILIMLLTMGLLSNLYAQNTVVPDERLSSRFSEERIQSWISNSPSLIELKNFEVENGYRIESLPEEKLADLPSLRVLDTNTKQAGEVVSNINEQEFNLYMYYFDRKFDSDVYYRIGNTNKVLIIPSSQKFTEMYNESRDYE